MARLPLVALVAVFGAAACASQTPQPAVPSTAPAPAASPPRAGRVALRPRFTFADGRTALAGTAFALHGTRPIAIIPTHVVLGVLRGSTLTRLELADAQSKALVASGVGLAAPPGAPMDGLDFSTDFAFVVLDGVPDGVARVELSPDRATVGEAVDVVACPADGSAPEITLGGTVTFASASRLELMLESAGAARGVSGAPILSRTTGRAVGIVQTVTPGPGGAALVRATPAEAIAPRLAEAERATRSLSYSAWAAAPGPG